MQSCLGSHHLQAYHFFATTTTTYDGTYNDGTVFTLSVDLEPFVETQPTSGKVGAGVRILGTSLDRRDQRHIQRHGDNLQLRPLTVILALMVGGIAGLYLSAPIAPCRELCGWKVSQATIAALIVNSATMAALAY